jgi:hypothetical protein
VLLVVSAALAMTGSTIYVEPAGKAKKAIAAKSEALRPTVYGEAVSVREGMRPEMELGHCRERVSKRSMSQKESNQVRINAPAEDCKGTYQDMERKA